MMESGHNLRHAANGILFLEGAMLTYTVYGGTNSSPQTTQVFGGGERSKTLMKWVSIAGAKCAAFAVLASLVSRSIWPAVGVLVSAVPMHLLYVHADNAARKRIAAGGGEAPDMDDGAARPSSAPTTFRGRTRA